MSLRRKPTEIKEETIDNFVKSSPGQTQTAERTSEQKPMQNNKPKKNNFKTRAITMTIPEAYIEWLDDIVIQVNERTERSVSRSECALAGLNLLKQKSVEEILEIIRNR